MFDPGNHNHPPVERPPMPLKELIALLERAITEMAERDGEISCFSPYDSYLSFANYLSELLEKLKRNDRSVLKEVRLVFLPTGEWDDSDGSPAIANEILNVLNRF